MRSRNNITNDYYFENSHIFANVVWKFTVSRVRCALFLYSTDGMNGFMKLSCVLKHNFL